MDENEIEAKQEKDAEKSTFTKAPYQPPTLTKLGSVAEITKGPGGGTFDEITIS